MSRVRHSHFEVVYFLPDEVGRERFWGMNFDIVIISRPAIVECPVDDECPIEGEVVEIERFHLVAFNEFHQLPDGGEFIIEGQVKAFEVFHVGAVCARHNCAQCDSDIAVLPEIFGFNCDRFKVGDPSIVCRWFHITENYTSKSCKNSGLCYNDSCWRSFLPAN